MLYTLYTHKHNQIQLAKYVFACPLFTYTFNVLYSACSALYSVFSAWMV